MTPISERGTKPRSAHESIGRRAMAREKEGVSKAVTLAPVVLGDEDARRLLRSCARRLERQAASVTSIGEIFADTATRAKALGPDTAADVICCASVFCDLRAQEWTFCVDRQGI